MKIAVIGANGQLGADVAQEFAKNGDHVFGFTHNDFDISKIDSVAAHLSEVSPDVIVNTAAVHHVEKCEQHPEGAFAVNAVGPRNLAIVAQEVGAILMHISTDYVFDGDKKTPYMETDTPRPLNVYGVTKLAGEHFVRCTAERHFVLRTSGLYGRYPCRGKGGLNFVELMLKLGKERGTVRVVASEQVSPTSTYDLAQQIVLLSRSDNFGLFHVTAEGSCTWYEFAREIFSLSSLPVQVEVAGAGEFPAKVPRPSYSVLENAALKKSNMNRMHPWREGLDQYLKNLRASSPGQAVLAHS